MEPRAERDLVRAIGRWDLVAITINAVIGGGIFGLPAKAQSIAGNYSLLAFIACAGFVMLLILCFAEVGSRFTGTGGPYLYARTAFGPAAGFTVGWLVWLARLTGFAANCNLLVGYAAYFAPAVGIGGGRAGLITALVVFYVAVNILGIRDSVVASNVTTVAKLGVVGVFIVLGLFSVEPTAFALGAPPPFSQFSTAVLLLTYAFTGFEMAVIPGGEVRDPQRSIPMALLTGLSLVCVIYTLIQVVCIGTLPELASSERPLADAARRFFGAAGGSLIAAGALVSIGGNLNVVLLAGSRTLFAMSERGECPAFLAATHRRFHTPHRAILLTGAIMLVLTVSGTFLYAVTVSTIARLVAYAATCLALVFLRRDRTASPALFRVPAGNLVAAAAIALIVWLLWQSTWREARDASLAVLAGLVLYFGYTRLVRRGSSPDASSSPPA